MNGNTALAYSVTQRRGALAPMRAWPRPHVGGQARKTLERIKIDPTHYMGRNDFVNPLALIEIEQIHRTGRIAEGDSDQS